MIRNFGANGLTMQPPGLNLGLGGSNTKNIQRGVTSFTSSEAIKTVNITAVDVNKSMLLISPKVTDVPAYSLIRGEFLSESQIRLMAGAAGAAHECAWQVIEFNNVKSKQTGEKTVNGTATQAITAVDLSKSIIVCSFRNSSYNNASINAYCEYYLSGSQEITFKTDGSTEIRWEVLEFN